MSAAPSNLDTRHTVETAEGARLQLIVAGPIIRGIAWFIDAVIRVALFSVLLFFSLLGIGDFDNSPFVFGILMLLYFLLSWLYPIIFETSTGATPGKRLLRLRVVHDNATPLTLGGSIIRNLLRSVDFLPMVYFTGLICCLIDNRFRRLGDLAAGTLVVYRDTTETTKQVFSHPRSAAPPNALTREERLAIVDFAERSVNLSQDRQRELANMLTHLMDSNDEPVETLKCWAERIMRGQSNA